MPISAGANAFLPNFLGQYNERFGKAASLRRGRPSPASAAHPLQDVFAWKEERTLSNNLTVQFDKVLFLLEPNEVTRALARQRVTIVDYPDGRIAIRHKGRDLPYRTFDKLQKVNQAAIVENKRLGEVLAYVAARQEQRTEGRSKKVPRRQGQAERHMFKVSSTGLREARSERRILELGGRPLRNPDQLRGRPPSRLRSDTECHFNFARQAPFLDCTDSPARVAARATIACWARPRDERNAKGPSKARPGKSATSDRSLMVSFSMVIPKRIVAAGSPPIPNAPSEIETESVRRATVNRARTIRNDREPSPLLLLHGYMECAWLVRGSHISARQGA